MPTFVPPDIWLEVFRYVPCRDLKECRLVCSVWNDWLCSAVLSACIVSTKSKERFTNVMGTFQKQCQQSLILSQMTSVTLQVTQNEGTPSPLQDDLPWLAILNQLLAGLPYLQQAKISFPASMWQSVHESNHIVVVPEFITSLCVVATPAVPGIPLYWLDNVLILGRLGRLNMGGIAHHEMLLPEKASLSSTKRRAYWQDVSSLDLHHVELSRCEWTQFVSYCHNLNRLVISSTLLTCRQAQEYATGPHPSLVEMLKAASIRNGLQWLQIYHPDYCSLADGLFVERHSSPPLDLSHFRALREVHLPAHFLLTKEDGEAHDAMCIRLPRRGLEHLHLAHCEITYRCAWEFNILYLLQAGIITRLTLEGLWYRFVNNPTDLLFRAASRVRTSTQLRMLLRQSKHHATSMTRSSSA